MVIPSVWFACVFVIGVKQLVIVITHRNTYMISRPWLSASCTHYLILCVASHLSYERAQLFASLFCSISIPLSPHIYSVLHQSCQRRKLLWIKNTLKLQGDIFRVELVIRKVGSECFGKSYAKRRNRRIISSELFSVLFQIWTQWKDLLLDTGKHELFAINTNPNSTHLVISYSQWTAQSFLCWKRGAQDLYLGQLSWQVQV